MNDVPALLQNLLDRGIRLTADAGRLRIDAPAGSLTAADRLALAHYKAELLAMLSPAERAGEPAAPAKPGTTGPTPPPGSRLLYRDADAHPCAAGISYMWTWEGGPRWFHTTDCPAPRGNGV